MDSEVIKSFLVGLGFGVDDASLTKFNKAIASATLRVAALYGSVKATTAVVAFGISKISESFEDLGYEYKIIAPAINKALILRHEMMKAYAATGVNLTRVVQNAVRLNISVTKTKYIFEALYKSAASRFFPLLTKQSDEFRRRLYENIPQIQEILERVIKGVFRAFDISLSFGTRLWSILGRVYDALKQLDEATNGWSTRILAVAAAWKILNLGFVNSQLGRFLLLLGAILVLYDDFKGKSEGKESFFDWSSFLPVIEAVKNILKEVWGVIKNVGIAFYDVGKALYYAFQFLLGHKGTGELDAWTAAVYRLWDALKGLARLLAWSFGILPGAVGGWLQHLLNNPNVQQNLQNGTGGVPSGNPLGSNTNNSLSNQNNVNQQTNVSIQGVTDAHLAYSLFSDQERRTNFDMSRYLSVPTTPRGATGG